MVQKNGSFLGKIFGKREEVAKISGLRHAHRCRFPTIR